jgi:hypothetical protein
MVGFISDLLVAEGLATESRVTKGFATSPA